MNDINNNKELQKLFEDYDKLGITPHRIMGLEKLLPHGHLKGITTAAGTIAAFAAAGLVKGAKFLGKQAFMKSGFLKVFKRIGETGEYVLEGKNAHLYRYSVKLPSGKKITSIEHYDDVKNKILNGIEKDIQEYKDFQIRNTNNQDNLNDKATIVQLTNKYKVFFENVNTKFSQLTQTDRDDVYKEFNKAFKVNWLEFTDGYIKSLIFKYRAKYLVGKKENPQSDTSDPNNPGQNKRLDRYTNVLKSAWNTVRMEIESKFFDMITEICRTAEFKELYDIVSSIYQNMPIGKKGAKKILDHAIPMIGPGNLSFSYIDDASSGQIEIIRDNNFNLSSSILLNISTNPDHIITNSILDLKLKDWEFESARYNLVYIGGNNPIKFEQENNKKIQINGKTYDIMCSLDKSNIPNGGTIEDNIEIEWRAKFDVNDNYYPIEGQTIISGSIKGKSIIQMNKI